MMHVFVCARMGVRRMQRNHRREMQAHTFRLPSLVPFSKPESWSQMRIVLSRELDTTKFSSGMFSRLVTQSLWGSNVHSSAHLELVGNPPDFETAHTTQHVHNISQHIRREHGEGFWETNTSKNVSELSETLYSTITRVSWMCTPPKKKMHNPFRNPNSEGEEKNKKILTKLPWGPTFVFDHPCPP